MFCRTLCRAGARRHQVPAYSDACYATGDAGGIDCDYPEDVLFKIVNRDLPGNSPDADAFLRAMNYSTADQIQMLSAIENDGLTADEAAAQWIEANFEVWSAWLPSS